jgi:hypothetical protein
MAFYRRFLSSEFDRDLVRPPGQHRVQRLGRLRQVCGVFCKPAAAPPLADRSFGRWKQTTWASKPAIEEYSRETSHIVNKYRPIPIVFFDIVASSAICLEIFSD